MHQEIVALRQVLKNSALRSTNYRNVLRFDPTEPRSECLVLRVGWDTFSAQVAIPDNHLRGICVCDVKVYTLARLLFRGRHSTKIELPGVLSELITVKVVFTQFP